VVSDITIIILSSIGGFIALLISGMASLIFFGLKRHVKRTDEQFDLHSEKLKMVADRFDLKSRDDDKRDEQLKAGRATFEEIRKSLKSINKWIESLPGQFVQTAQFENFCETYRLDKVEQDKRIAEIRAGWEDIRGEIHGIGQRVDGALRAITDIVAREHGPVGSQEVPQ